MNSNSSFPSSQYASSMGVSQSSSFCLDELQMLGRPTLEVHQAYFARLGEVVGKVPLPLKGHWKNGINDGDEIAIRRCIDVALAWDKALTIPLLKKYGEALDAQLGGNACCLGHTRRIRILIAQILDMKGKPETVDPSRPVVRGVDVLGNNNEVQVIGNDNSVGVSGSGNTVIVHGNVNNALSIFGNPRSPVRVSVLRPNNAEDRTGAHEMTGLNHDSSVLQLQDNKQNT